MDNLNDFSWALIALKAGRKVTRQEWMEKYPETVKPWLQILPSNNFISLCSPTIPKPDVWRIDPLDILKTDWMILVE
jgi:hypothetical protein